MGSRVLIIGSRGSALALWQANYVAGRLRELKIETRIEIIKTSGDHMASASLSKAGGKGLFTKEIEDALLSGAIDVAVHSLKDLPTETPPGLAIAAIPEREDARDALAGHTLDSLPRAARVGTSSPRRSAQLLNLRDDLNIVPIRGNVDTRLRKLKEGEFDAIILAVAGLRRLGLEAAITQVFSPDEMCCAPGQGALAIQTRESGAERDTCSRLNHVESERAVKCERAVLAALGGGCQLPIGAFAVVNGSRLQLTAVVASPDGTTLIREKEQGLASEPVELGGLVAERLRLRGASKLLGALAPAQL
ncbi:MAG: hydroxymethylbilane synthase [Bryobacteraceae bacterium]